MIARAVRQSSLGKAVGCPCLNAKMGRAMEINSALREYQLDRDEALSMLHMYLPAIIERFYGGELPLPALSLEESRRGNLGSYREQDGLALCHRINVNSLYADRPLADHLMVIAHECGHLWQRLYGKPPRPPHRGYHNKQLQLKLQEIGIPCDSLGHALGMQEPFISFLKELGVDAQVLPLKQEIQEGKRKPKSRLKPWQCKCTRVWASIRVEVKAHCFKCSHQFQPQWSREEDE